MSHIVSLSAENILRLVAVHITPDKDGNLVVISGNNGNGKSSVLASIAMALGGGPEVPDLPVRQGQEKGVIVLETEDLKITRRFTAKGGTTLAVENKDGLVYKSPQEILNKLTGRLTFDPLEFVNLKPAPQLEMLKRIVGLDFTALDAERKRLYDERTLVNREADKAQAKADFMPHHPDAPAEEASVTAIVAERDAAKEHNAKQAELTRAEREAEDALAQTINLRSAYLTDIERLEAMLKLARERAAECDEKIPALKTRLSAAQEQSQKFTAIDLKPITERLATAESTNQKVRQNKARQETEKFAEMIRLQADGLTKQIEAVDKQKETELAAAKFPVPGMSFNETGVLFNGLPFVQASTAEKLRASVAMAAALNPKLRVMLVRSGNDLDRNGLRLLAELAKEHDLQVWLERVEPGDVPAVVIEDGAVKEPLAVANA